MDAQNEIIGEKKKKNIIDIKKFIHLWNSAEPEERAWAKGLPLRTPSISPGSTRCPRTFTCGAAWMGGGATVRERVGFTMRSFLAKDFIPVFDFIPAS